MKRSKRYKFQKQLENLIQILFTHRYISYSMTIYFCKLVLV
jgi:hypothetical protein